jgi:hypothetical protein
MTDDAHYDQMARHRSDRIMLWQRLTVSIQGDWQKIEQAGLDLALEASLDLLMGRVKTAEIFRATQGDCAAIVTDAEELSSDVNRICEMVALVTGSMVHANDPDILKRSRAILHAATDLRECLDRFQLAATDFRDGFPLQPGGRGVLSDQLTGGMSGRFREFAEITRTVWRKAGLSIGGNGVPDQGFTKFLDAVHNEVFGRSIPGRSALLAALRNSWPKPRIR